MPDAVSRSAAIQPQPYAGPSVRTGGAAAGARADSTNASASAGTTPDAAATQAEVAELQATDARVRAHEAAHRAAAGELARGGSYNYRTGPDGRAYAVGGEVGIDASVVSGDPAATLAKMQQVQRAALAPVDPSPQDRRVAALAANRAQLARSELAIGTTATDDIASTDDGMASADAADGSQPARPETTAATDATAVAASASASASDPLAAATERPGLPPALIERALAAYAAATQWTGFSGGLHLVA